MSRRFGASSARVAVLGAGIAGLSAARALVGQGHSVCVFDARARIGGRVAGAWNDGHWMDTTWPTIGSRDVAMARLGFELGLSDSMWPLRPVQTLLMRRGEAKPVDASTLAGASRIPGPSLIERAKLLRFSRLADRYASSLDDRFPERAASLDDRSVKEHAELYFGRGNLAFWLAPELHSAYGDSIDDLSRVALLQHLRAVGIGEDRPGLPGLPRRPLLELLDTSTEGLELRLRIGIERIRAVTGRRLRVEMAGPSGETEQEYYDAVICALGPREAARSCAHLLTPAERDFFAATEEREVTILAVAIDGVSSGLPQEIRIPRCEGSAIASILIEPGQVSGRVPVGASQITLLARSAFASRCVEMADDVVAKNLLSSLELALPGTGDRLKSTLLGRSRAPFFRVGSYKRLAAFDNVQRDSRRLGRRLYWAGDYLSGGSFEAARLSGLRAAEALCEDFFDSKSG